MTAIGLLAFGWALGDDWSGDLLRTFLEDYDSDFEDFYLASVGFENPYPNPWDVVSPRWGHMTALERATWRRDSAGERERYDSARTTAAAEPTFELVAYGLSDRPGYVLTTPDLYWAASHDTEALPLPSEILSGDNLIRARDRLNVQAKLLQVTPPEPARLILTAYGS